MDSGKPSNLRFVRKEDEKYNPLSLIPKSKTNNQKRGPARKRIRILVLFLYSETNN